MSRDCRLCNEEKKCKKTKVAYSDSPALFFSEVVPTSGIRYIGLGSTSTTFLGASYILAESAPYYKMCVAVKNIPEITNDFTVQFVFTYMRTDVNNNYSYSPMQTHITTVVAISSSNISRCGDVKVEPELCLRHCDLVAVYVIPSDTSVTFQATACVM